MLEREESSVACRAASDPGTENVSLTTFICLQAGGAVLVLFALSWRLGPILAGVIIATAFTATLYKNQTKAVETENANATNEMNNIANQAFESITTVRYRMPFLEDLDIGPSSW